MVEKSLDGIKAVNDIPRQYRRTNRAEPKEPSTYVASLIKPSTEYYNSTKDTSNWIAIIFEQIANQYAKRITEVLEGLIQNLSENLSHFNFSVKKNGGEFRKIETNEKDKSN